MSIPGRWRCVLQDAALGLALGAVLALAAWGEQRVPILAVALPVLVVYSRTRVQAFFVGFGYAAGVLRYVASFIASWFSDNLTVGALAVLAYALITGAVWCCGWSASPRLWRKALAIIFAWVLALALSIGAPGHPVIAMGYLLPGTGWAGVAASVLLAPAVLWVGRSKPVEGPRAGAVLAGVAAVALAVAGVLAYRPVPAQPSGDVLAEKTTWGLLRTEDQALTRLQRMGQLQPPPRAGVVTVVWPESIIGRYDPSLYQVLDLELLRQSRRAGRTQIVGMDIPTPGERMLNAAVAFYPDGHTATAVARQPAPLSLWRPWRTTRTFVADWTADNILSLGQGDRAAVIFCYEEYMPVLYLLNEALDSPTVYLALTNTWAAPQRTAATIQTWHSLGMARLFGRPYLKAENGPGA